MERRAEGDGETEMITKGFKDSRIRGFEGSGIKQNFKKFIPSLDPLTPMPLDPLFYLGVL